MSLEGSIKEFGLAEILQLISMQKKSGVVSISHGRESTTLHFDNGQLVFATSISGGETKRLGEILVNSGKLTEDNVSESLRIQAMTKERIGNLFVSSGHVSTDEVKEALQQQLIEVIFGTEEITKPEETGIEFHENRIKSGIRLQYAFQAAILAFIVSSILLLFPAGEMAGLRKITGVSDFLRHQQTAAELKRLHKAIGYYLLVNGDIPDSISTLSSEKYIDNGISSDDWQDKFVYEKYPVDKSSSDYRLYSKSPLNHIAR